ncbi:MAG TPA: SCO family protein [Prolixibacteraceae bacterium]|nr:SCO family protein [Prolixibacteraceae bacterium]
MNNRKIQGNLFRLFLLVFFLSGFQAPAQSVISTADEMEIGVVEHLDEFLPDSISLINEQGQQVWLADLIDKPTVLNFVYFRCPGICSPLMEGIAGVIDKSELVLGKDYQVLTISFDPRETIDLGILKKNNYLNLMQKREEAGQGWRFFVSDSASIARATNAVGFRYKKTGNDFLHAASVVVISPQGKITRYLNGMYFLPFEWKMAIIEASEGKSGPTLNKVLRFCYSYDPVGQTYALNIMRLGGAFIMFFAILFLLYLVLKPRRKSSH